MKISSSKTDYVSTDMDEDQELTIELDVINLRRVTDWAQDSTWKELMEDE